MEVILLFWLLCAGLGMVIANAKNRSLAEGFFLSLLCGIFGVIIVALLPKQLPKAPAGLTAVICPRCSAAQNVPNPSNYECWQCHLRVAPPIQPIPTLPTGEKKAVTCPGCSTRLVLADYTKPKFRCAKCGGQWPIPIPRQ